MQLSADEKKLLRQIIDGGGFVNLRTVSPAKKQILKRLYKKGLAMEAWAVTVRGEEAVAKPPLGERIVQGLEAFAERLENADDRGTTDLPGSSS